MALGQMQVRELSHGWVERASGIWTELIRHSDANPVFTSWAWTSSWLDTIDDKASVRLHGVFEGDRLIAILPLHTKRAAASLWGKHLSLVGGGQLGADYGDAPCRRGFEIAAAHAVADWLLGRNDWVQCEFRDVLQTAFIRRVAGIMSANTSVEERLGSICPRTSLILGWKGILRDQFDKKHRYNIERQLRLAKEKNSFRMVIYDTPDAVSRVFPVLVSLHNERKSAQGVHSSFSRPDRLKFHTLAIARLSESRAAFVATIESQKEIVSAAYCLRDDKSVYYFQTGMSATGATLGAGSTLLFMLLRWAADQGYEWFDFLQGEEGYKQAWATDRVEQRTITVTRTSARGHLTLTVAKTRIALSRLRKHLRGDGVTGQ